MIPKIIHQTSKRLTREENRLTSRMRRQLPEWDYKLWTDAANDELVANQFPEFLEIYQHIRRGVVKADIARYMYLSVYGGFYFDTDYKVLRAIDSKILRHACVLPISTRSESQFFRLGNAVMGSVAGYPFWRDLLANIFNSGRLEGIREEMVEKVTGPEGLTDFFLSRQEHYQDVYLAPNPIFHPQHRSSSFSFVDSEMTVGVHLCWGSWRSKNLLRSVRSVLHRKITSF
jgi:mannosyltransferase OCH1-like enzyme